MAHHVRVSGKISSASGQELLNIAFSNLKITMKLLEDEIIFAFYQTVHGCKTMRAAQADVVMVRGFMRAWQRDLVQ